MIAVPLRILLIEDNEADIILMQRALRKILENPIVEVVEDLDSCNTKMINFVPDIVISDYNLPTCTGFEVMQLVQQRDANVPFIFVTGTVEDDELAANTILSGAWGYILKKDMPVLHEKLKPLIKKAVFRMITSDKVRERLRKNKIAINQIYDYLDSLHSDNLEQQENINKIKREIEELKSDKDA